MLEMGRGRFRGRFCLDEALRGEPYPRRRPAAGIQSPSIAPGRAGSFILCRSSFRFGLVIGAKVGLIS